MGGEGSGRKPDPLKLILGNKSPELNPIIPTGDGIFLPNYSGLKSGTKKTDTLTNGSVIFTDGTTLTENNANFFWDNTNARLGIGTASPNYNLEVNATSTGDSTLDTIANFRKSATNYPALRIRAKNGLLDLSADYDVGGGGPTSALSLSTSNTTNEGVERMRIDPNGNVGIGTTAPGTNLDIQSTNANQEYLSDTTNVAHGMTTLVPTGTYGSLGKVSGLTGGLFIQGFDESANQGLGFQGVNVTASASTPIMFFRAGKKSGTTGTSPAATDLAFDFEPYGGASSWLSILGNGNVGIGTTTPGAKLQVAGTTFINTTAQISGVSAAKLTVVQTAATADWTAVIKGGTTAGSSYGLRIDGGINSSDYALYVNNSSAANLFNVRGDGSVGIGTTAPSTKFHLSGSATFSNQPTPSNPASTEGVIFLSGGALWFIGGSGTSTKIANA